MKFTMTKIAAALALTAVATGAQANSFDFLAGNTTTLAGSWFSMLAMDSDEDGIPDTNVYTGLRGAGTTGIDPVLAGGTLNFDITNTITVGATPGAHNAGNMIDRDWSFFSAWGAHYTNGPLAVTWDGVSNTATVDMTGWTVAWNAGSIDMGAGSPAVIDNVDGIWGNGNDTLNYSAIVPSGGFAGVSYALRMEGSANLTAPVPEASTYGMMLAGLGLVGFAVRRRKLMA